MKFQRKSIPVALTSALLAGLLLSGAVGAASAPPGGGRIKLDPTLRVHPLLQYGAQAEPEGWAFADVFYDVLSREAVKPISRGLICLNPARQWKVGFDGDLQRYDLRYTLGLGWNF